MGVAAYAGHRAVALAFVQVHVDALEQPRVARQLQSLGLGATQARAVHAPVKDLTLLTRVVRPYDVDPTCLVRFCTQASSASIPGCIGSVDAESVGIVAFISSLVGIFLKLDQISSVGSIGTVSDDGACGFFIGDVLALAGPEFAIRTLLEVPQNGLAVGDRQVVACSAQVALVQGDGLLHERPVGR